MQDTSRRHKRNRTSPSVSEQIERIAVEIARGWPTDWRSRIRPELDNGVVPNRVWTKDMERLATVHNFAVATGQNLQDEMPCAVGESVSFEVINLDTVPSGSRRHIQPEYVANKRSGHGNVLKASNPHLNVKRERKRRPKVFALSARKKRLPTGVHASGNNGILKGKGGKKGNASWE